jgi:hypothetical protein
MQLEDIDLTKVNKQVWLSFLNDGESALPDIA